MALNSVVQLMLIILLIILSAFINPSLAASSNGLKLVRVNLPQYRKPGELAQLQCDYDLGNDTLYAVKWYKDNEEFYRFVTKERPQATSHRVEGVDVDVSLSNSRKVILRGVSLRTGGLYRCEVSAEAPSFASAQSEARLEVISLPSEDPKITGVEVQYQIGDEINLNCTSGMSFPASVLHWHINEEQVSSNNVLINYPPTINRQGLLTSVLGLRFSLSDHHFHGGSMRVKCVASVSRSHFDDRTSVVENLPIADLREALLLVKNAGNSKELVITMILITLLHIAMN